MEWKNQFKGGISGQCIWPAVPPLKLGLKSSGFPSCRLRQHKQSVRAWYAPPSLFTLHPVLFYPFPAVAHRAIDTSTKGQGGQRWRPSRSGTFGRNRECPRWLYGKCRYTGKEAQVCKSRQRFVSLWKRLQGSFGSRGIRIAASNSFHSFVIFPPFAVKHRLRRISWLRWFWQKVHPVPSPGVLHPDESHPWSIRRQIVYL